MNDHYSPDEQALIEQLRSTPRPRLRPSADEAIRQQVLNELHAVRVSRTSRRLPEHGPNGWTRRPLVLIAAVAAFAILTYAWLQSQVPDQTLSVPATPQTTYIAQIATLADTQTVTATQIMTTTIVASAAPVGTVSEPPPMATPTPSARIAIEGPITSVEGNMMTIYGFEVVVEPGHPILDLVDVGDVVRVEGLQESQTTIVASVISNLTAITPVSDREQPTVGLDGPVEVIEENTIVVNSIPVQLDPDDPILRTLEVGDYVSIQGNFQQDDTMIVLVVVEITVINDVTLIPANCWYHDTASGMGHWHCDGMGMGMGAAGMGMGDPGMAAMGMGQ